MTLQLQSSHYPIDSSALPASWQTVMVGEVADAIHPGFASGEHNQTGTGVPHIRPMNISRLGFIDLDAVKYVSPEKPLRLAVGDVLFNNTNSPSLVGKTTAIRVREDWAFSNHMTRIRLHPDMDYRFVAAQLHYLWMTGFFRHLCVHHVNQASVSTTVLSSQVPLVIAPPNEQRRIVAKIDELFSDLDAGVAALERAKANLKRYRAAVLKAAVEGKLTEQWRAEHPATEPASKLLERILAGRRKKWEVDQLAKYAATGKTPPKDWREKYVEPAGPDLAMLPALPEGWCWVTMAALVEGGPQNGAYYPKDLYGRGVPILRIDDYQSFSSRSADELQVVDAHSGYSVYILREGDLLINRVNSLTHLGKALLVEPRHIPAIFESNMMRLRITPLVSPAFVRDCLRSNEGRRRLILNAKWAVNQASINQQDVLACPVPLPPHEAQVQVIAEVERNLSAVQASEKEIEACLKRAARLRQGILKQAFEGKLVAQNPADEPASVLLERIRRQRASSANAKGAKINSRGRRRSPKGPSPEPN